MMTSPETNAYDRRTFIAQVAKASGAATLLSMMPDAHAAPSAKTYTVQDVQDIILKEVPRAPFADTVDTLKSGTPTQTVTGIVTTMFATVDVIRQAAQRKANFIIAHEPTFYNHLDKTDWAPGNVIVEEKQALLKQHNIAVWRFHDYWHAHRPDGIFTGVLKKAGWQQYYKEGSPLLAIPPTTVKTIAEHFKKTLGITQVRVVGDLALACSSVGLLPGAYGGQRQVTFALQHKPDVLIVGETPEWETVEFFRDAVALNRKTALIVLGHSVSEEPGMEWLVEWLKPRLEGVSVSHIASTSPFKLV